MKRRNFIQKSVWGTGGLLLANQGYNSLAWLASRVHGQATFDSSLILQAALQAGNPMLTEAALADAAAANDTVLVTIKVMNLMHTPLCIKLGKRTPTEADAFAVDNYTGRASLSLGNVGQDGKPLGATDLSITLDKRFEDPNVFALLNARGVDQLSNNVRWAALRLNRWFAGILQTGTHEAGAPSALASEGAPVEFPTPDEVAFQTILHVSQNDTLRNHSYVNLAMQGGSDPTGPGGDLAFHVQRAGIVKSPLGLTCFRMGNKTKTTDNPSQVFNHILAGNLSTKAAEGQSVATYVSLLQQSVGLGFVDNNLMGKFDSLANTDVALRSVINDNRQALKSSIESVRSASEVETRLNVMTLGANQSAANIQAFGGSAQASKCEFLGQCLFVKKALDIPNKPFRNFTLSLNMRDMDGDKLDITRTGSGEETHNLSNVEGMRQLALGLNMLAQSIKRHRNVYVIVITEGGRGINGGDNKMSHAFLMGPGGGGNLKDYLYSNDDINDSTNPVVREPNEGSVGAVNSPGLTTNGAGFRQLPATDVRNALGSPTSAIMTTSGVLSGVCKYLEDKAGLPTTLPASFGNYLYIQRR